MLRRASGSHPRDSPAEPPDQLRRPIACAGAVSCICLFCGPAEVRIAAHPSLDLALMLWSTQEQHGCPEGDKAPLEHHPQHDSKITGLMDVAAQHDADQYGEKIQPRPRIRDGYMPKEVVVQWGRLTTDQP